MSEITWSQRSTSGLPAIWSNRKRSFFHAQSRTAFVSFVVGPIIPLSERSPKPAVLRARHRSPREKELAEDTKNLELFVGQFVTDLGASFIRVCDSDRFGRSVKRTPFPRIVDCLSQQILN